MEKIIEIIKALEKKYPNAKTELEYDHKFPYQLVVAVMLSAQATDKQVNKATPALFEKYKTPEDFANANFEKLTKYTKSINFYNAKTKRIIENAKKLMELYNGKIPKTIKDLVKLPGVGRKSANVILQEIYGIGEGVVVDTHMIRVGRRLGFHNFTKGSDAEKAEKVLNEIVPKNKYIIFSRGIVLTGRYICKAKKPDCANCILNKICPKIGI